MEEISIGKSKDSVFRTELNGETVYIKTGGRQVRDEHERLAWLQGKLPVARVISFEAGKDVNRLTTSAVPGIMAHECKPEEREQVVKNIAAALRHIHSLPIDGCPFDRTIDVQLNDAITNTNAGVVDEWDFDKAHLGMTAQELLPMLLASKPTVFDYVFTHGDYCLPNILIDPATLEVNGFIDLGRAAISDRYVDLGIALNTLDHNFGPGYEAIFFEAYGIQEVDRSRIAFYKMLDEFF